MKTTGSPDARLSAAIEAARKAPEREGHWNEVEHLAAALQKPEEVAALYREVLAKSLTASDKTKLGLRALRFHDEWFGGEDSPELLELLRRLLEASPAEETALSRLSVALTVGGRWDELLGAYDRAIAATEGARRMRLLDEALQVAKDFAVQPDRAIGYLQQLLPLRAGDALLADALERLLERKQRWADLIELWKSRAAGASPSEAQATSERVAECWLDKLSDPAAALREIEALLPAAADGARALSIVERVLAREDAPVDVRMKALGLLRDRFHQRGRADEVVRVLEAALEFADPRAEVELRRELGERLPALGRDLDAMAQLAAVLTRMPGDESARAVLRSLAERTGERQRYVSALLAAAEGAAAPERSALLVEAAEARAAELGDAGGAIELLSRVLADQATPRETALAVARRSSELLGREDRQAELCGVLEKLVELEPEVLIQRDALRRAAMLARKLGEMDRSIASWRALLARAPEDLEAIDSLGELLAEERRWPAVVELLRKRREVPAARRDRRADLVRIAKVSAERLADLPAATVAWTELADEFGEDSEVVDALHELYQKQERWSDLGALLARADARETSHLTDLLVSLADARRLHLGDPQGAVAAYRRALERDPRGERSLAGLRALLEGPTRAEAVDALATAYAAVRDAAALDELLEARLSTRATDAEKVRLLREHAASAEVRNNPGSALASLARALPLSPHDVQLERDVLRLAGAARSAGAEATPGETAARAKAAAAFREAAVAAEGAGAILRAGALYRTAGDLDEKRNALAEAFANYRDAARVVPEAVVTATALTRVGARAGRWQDVARVIVASAAARHQVEEALLADVEAVADADPRGEAWTAAAAAFEQALSAADQLPDGVGYLIEARVAVWHDARRGDLEAAEAAWERALARDPQRREALEALVDVRRRMHDAGADAPRARALIEALCRLADRRRRDLDPIREAAELASGGEGSGAGAQAILRRAFDDASRAWRAGERAEGAHQPQETAIWALERLLSSLSSAGGHAAALDALVEASHLPVEPSLANEYLYRAAAIAEESLADSARAIELYRNVLRKAPDDARALERLGSILEREQRLPELLALRRHEVGLTKSVERRLSLRLAIARVVGSIEERGGRVEALRQNLEEAPGHEASIDEICGVLDAKGRHEELVDLLTEQARRVEGAPRASRPPEAAVRAGKLWGRVARLAEMALSDDERALEAHRRVVALAPTTEALDALARLHEARAEHAAAARWLERRLEGAAAEERVEVALRLSRAHVAAGQHGRAITWLERTLPRHPEATELRMLLAELYRGAEAWAPLAKLLYEGCPYAQGDELLAMVREAAELYHDRLGTPERAIPLLEQAVKLVPDDRWVRLTLADGLRVVERYDEARELLEGVITDYGRRRSPERAAVHLQLARVLRAQGRLGEALAQLDLASSMKVGDPEILATLGDVAREAGQLDRAEQAYRALLLIVRRSQDASLDAIGASEVLYALSRICVGQGHLDQAAELADSALATAAASALEARRFRRAALAADEPDLAVRALQLRLGAESDPRAKAELLSTLAEIFEGPLDRKTDALQARLDALDGAPDSLALHTGIRALAKELGRIDDYIERLTELVEARRRAEEAQVVSLLQLRLGEVVEQDQGDLARASEIYGRVEAMRHHAVEAKKALARVAGMRGVSADERRRLEEIVALEGAPDDAKVDALYRLADIDVVGPENRARGLAALEDALERDPQYARAARTLREAADGAPDDADLWALYERVSRVSGDDGLLLEYLERRARHPAVTLEELRDAVTLAGRSGTSDREQALLERTVERAREHPRGLQEALWAAEALAERARQADDRAGAIRWLREAAAATEGDVHKQLMLRAAALAGDSAEALRTAAELYEQLLEHGETGRDVWEPLLEVYRRSGDAARLAALCTSTLETLPTSADRNALRNNQAEWLLERGPGDLAERRQGAMALLRDVMAEVPDDAEAAAKLAALYGHAGEVDALAELLSRQLDHARDRQDANAAVEVSLRLAGVLQKSRPEDAKDALRAALEWAPQDRSVLTRLLELLRGNDDARERAERMEQLLATESGAAAAKLARKVATAWQELDEPSGVQRALEAGYRGAPADKEIRQRLERWHREREEWGSLAGFLVRDAARQEAAADALSRYREAATLYKERLDDPASAAEALRRAVEQSPHEIELVRELCAMRAADGDPRLGVEDVGAALARLDGDDPRALDLYKLRADLLTDLGREDQALGDLENAFALGGVAEAPSLVAALQRRRDRAGRGGDLSAERAATMRLVEVLVGAADTEGARDALIGWVAADPTDRDAIRALRDMDDAAGRWAEVAESCRRLIGLEVGSERIDAALRLADACVRAGDPAAARAGLEQAYAADTTATLRNQLRKLYETIGAHRERAEMMLADAEGVGDDSGRFTLLMQAADLLLNRANDPAEALAPLRSAVALKPDDADAMLLLVDACIAGGLLEEATKRLDAAISAMGRRRTPELGLLQHRMARVAEAYGDTRRQRDWLIASVDTDRNNGEAAADLADLSIRLGDHDTALKALRLVTLLKTPCRMSRAMAFLRQAQIAHRQGDAQKALVFARRARAEDAQLTEASDFLRQLGDA